MERLERAYKRKSNGKEEGKKGGGEMGEGEGAEAE